KRHGDIPAMEEKVLQQNPHLKEIWNNAKFLFKKPEVINEVSFATKSPVENHILMCGDAAGMITPLCGNGMAMAIYSAKILSDRVLKYLKEKSYTRLQLENDYRREWNGLFKNRLWVGRQLQSLFGSEFVSTFSVNLANYFPPIASFFISKTHGQEF
ncbi:MAG: FAD-dependent oxidoreductase, partial [Bacteroidota bacterium]